MLLRISNSNRLQAIHADAKGEVTLEFALTLPSIVFVTLWFFELTMAVYTYTVLSDAAKEGVRYAVVHGALSPSPSGPVCPCSAVENVVRSYAQISFHDVSGMAVTVTYPDLTLNLPSSLVKVTVTYTYVPFLNLPWIVPLLKAGAEGRIVF